MNRKSLLYTIVSIFMYVVSVLLIAYSIWSFIKGKDYLSSMGVTFRGSEYDVTNFYMTSFGSYVVYAFILIALGLILHMNNTTVRIENDSTNHIDKQSLTDNNDDESNGDNNDEELEEWLEENSDETEEEKV